MSITTKRLALLGTALTAMTATAVFSAAPAFAGTDALSEVDGHCSTSSGAADGYFESTGDVFTIHDWCPDGHSVTLYVDVAPISIGNTWDFSYQNKGGYGSELYKSHNIPEGTKVEIQACVTEGSTRLVCGYWAHGVA
jgi:hypothetical protein